jgi:hypothetical protein
VETRVEERNWKKIEKKLPKEYKWERKWAKGEKKKRKSCRGNINRGEVGDGKKTKIKGSRRRVHGKKRPYRQRVVENNNSVTSVTS